TLRSGQMNLSDLAAPDDEGIMFSAAAQESRRSFIGWSVSDWVFVYACTVTKKPFWMPNASRKTLTTDASALVVQLAMLTMCWVFGSNVSALIPGSRTASASSRVFGAALISTCCAPWLICSCAAERVV